MDPEIVRLLRIIEDDVMPNQSPQVKMAKVEFKSFPTKPSRVFLEFQRGEDGRGIEVSLGCRGPDLRGPDSFSAFSWLIET